MTSSPANSPLDLDVVIIACNNERTIRRTLESVRGLAQRVIVVDSGSTDRTREICRELGAEVIEHAWEGHIAQKQFALEQATAKWILSLDSDESPDEELQRSIRRALEASEREEEEADDASSAERIAGYAMNRRTWFGGHELAHAWQPEWRTRLVRRGAARWTGYNPHDRLEADGDTTTERGGQGRRSRGGRVVRLSGNLRHDSFENVTNFLHKQVAHGLNAAESYYFTLGRRGSALRLLISPVAAVFKQLAVRSSWRDGWRGWAAAFGTGLGVAAKHMRLLELTYSSSAPDRPRRPERGVSADVTSDDTVSTMMRES